MPTPDTARELKPVVMFDGDNDPKVTRDFRPISEHVDNVKRRSKVVEAPTATEKPTDPSTSEQPDEAPEHDPGIAPPEVDAPDDEEPTSPPDVAPEGPAEPDPTPSDDAIPSPWDAPTSG